MRIRTFVAAVPAAALLAAALSVPAATAQPGAGCTSWQVVTTPPEPGVGTPSADLEEVALTSVSVLSPSDAWLTGYAEPYVTPYPYGGPNQTWALRWDGRSLTQPAQPALIPGANHLIFDPLLPASFDSATDGWQVFGKDSADNIPSWDDETTFAEHWHDGQWTLTPMAVSPDPAHKGIKLFAVAAVSPDNAWAAGTFYAVGSGNLFGVTEVGTLIEHWDGTAWAIVPNPAANQAGASLQALSVVSPSDIWAVGYQGDVTGQTLSPLIEHWNGTGWTVVPAPPGQGRSMLYAVSADGPADAWAAGTQNMSGFDGPPLIEHWNGSTWATVSLPPAVRSAYNPSGAWLDAIYAASPSDVWAGAATGDPANETATPAGNGDLLHWDGSSWSLVPTGPQEYGLAYSVSALGGTGTGDVWAAGSVYRGQDPFVFGPLAAHLSCGPSRS